MSYKVTWHQFTQHPDSDSCWSLSTGPDGRIYAAACAEGVPGGIVKLVRYNEHTDGLDYLFDLDEMVDDPRDSGRATQCKIHYSFVPSMADGILYMATHLSGPPIDLPAYSPWNFWPDPERCFRGSALLAFNPRTDEVLWWDTMIPKEGCRCLVHDGGRACHLLVGMFHGITGMVFDMGTVPGADHVAAICCGREKFFAAVNGPNGGQLIGRALEPMPFDLIQEWHISRSPLETLPWPIGPERILHAVTDEERRAALVSTEAHLLRVNIETGTVDVLAELHPRGRLGRGARGVAYGLDEDRTLWRCRVQAGLLERRSLALPEGTWGSGVAWAADPAAQTTYIADEAGELFILDAAGKVHSTSAYVPHAPVTSMSVTLDGRLFGTAGEEMSRLFCYHPRTGSVTDLGVPVSVYERRRYGYSFADAVTGRDGEIIFAENDNLGHLWLYFPKIQPCRQPESVNQE